ncbi:hypothetical protein [Colwellia sp. 75C3]|uniref:hypothetical protein n=1 Tax=Colwellia sp. 75C3 TaxID=888425 RepID=UPI0012FEBBEA|nr:hypothetical protein [Colwellia sp. 75C3]
MSLFMMRGGAILADDAVGAPEIIDCTVLKDTCYLVLLGGEYRRCFGQFGLCCG